MVDLLQQLPGFEPQERFWMVGSGHMRLPACCTASSAAEPSLGAGEQDQPDDPSRYIGRNPASGAWYAHLQNGYRVSRRRIWMRRCTRVSPLRPKPVAVRLLRLRQDAHAGADSGMYPQALHHPDYDITQLVYLRSTAQLTVTWMSCA